MFVPQWAWSSVGIDYELYILDFIFCFVDLFCFCTFGKNRFGGDIGSVGGCADFYGYYRGFGYFRRFSRRVFRSMAKPKEINMKIFVKAKSGAKEAGVEKIDEAHFVVAVREPAKEGRANEAVARALADCFGVLRGRVRLISGFSSRQKIFEIL